MRNENESLSVHLAAVCQLEEQVDKRVERDSEAGMAELKGETRLRRSKAPIAEFDLGLGVSALIGV